MELTLTTPAVLFPAISLLLLAYTNRFLAIANLIRNLKMQYTSNHDPNLLEQISNLRKRIYIIRNMQGFAIMSFFMCVLSMWLLFNNTQDFAKYIFGFSLLSLMISLYLSFREIQISVNALKIELSDLEESIAEHRTGLSRSIRETIKRK